jgi:hypothetical protein
VFSSSGEGRETPTAFGPLVSEVSSFWGTQHITRLPSHFMTETDPVSGTLCFVVIRIPDDGQSPETQWSRVLNTVVSTLYILMIPSFDAVRLKNIFK